jgi:hypothetical protein
VIPPVAPTDEENVQLYESGSNVPATLYWSTWLRATPPMLLSRRRRVQPGGDVIASLPDRRAVTTAIMTSPGSVAGRSIVSERAFEVRAVVLSRTTMVPRIVPCRSG